MIFKFNLPTKVSTNKYYGMHWAKKMKMVDEYNEVVFAELLVQKIQPIKNQVEVNYRFYFKGKLLDWTNCSAMAKMIEDQMVRSGIFKDDSPKYIARGKLESIKTTTKKDYVIVSCVLYRKNTKN